jgi:hypothetical protein
MRPLLCRPVCERVPDPPGVSWTVHLRSASSAMPRRRRTHHRRVSAAARSRSRRAITTGVPNQSLSSRSERAMRVLASGQNPFTTVFTARPRLTDSL